MSDLLGALVMVVLIIGALVALYAVAARKDRR